MSNWKDVLKSVSNTTKKKKKEEEGVVELKASELSDSFRQVLDEAASQNAFNKRLREIENGLLNTPEFAPTKKAKEELAKTAARKQLNNSIGNVVNTVSKPVTNFAQTAGNTLLYAGMNSPLAAATPSTVVHNLKNKKDDSADDRTWFKNADLFDDGWQFGDLWLTAQSSFQDVLEEISEGAVESAENVIDTGAYLYGGAAGLLGFDDTQEEMADFIARDIIDSEYVVQNVNPFFKYSVANLLGHDVEDASIFGEKSDSLANSGGQLLTQVGLQAAGVPWWVTSGVTSFGSGTEQQLNEGASYGQAGGIGLVNAGAEILTEKLFGDSILGEKGLIDMGGLTKGISNKTMKLAADYGLTWLTNGTEEFGSAFFSRLGEAIIKEENAIELLTNEEALDEYLESFIGGMVMSGVTNAPKAVRSHQTGADYNTGLTADEESVVNKEVEKRIAEQEKNGKKLSKNEKGKIFQQVIEAMDEGSLSTDLIEEVLGGDTFKSYQDTMASEESTLKEFQELYQGEELEQQIKDLKANSKLGDIKKQLGSEVFDKVKGSRLSETYIERGRRGQKFTADLSKYDEKQGAIIQKAVDSGILNNTRRTHKFVDWIAKVSADKGVHFDFVNNEKLKNSGFAVDGKTVNGYVTENGDVVLNVQSAKALNTTVGHEITHVLEGTELYNALASEIKSYAESKKASDSKFANEYIERLYNTRELYKTVKGYEGVDGHEKIKREVVADLVGDYLFTDGDFVMNLSAKNRNLFQKIYDEIKYLCKTITAGSAEAERLLAVKKAFEDAYRAGSNAQKNTTTESGAKYSISKAIVDVNGKEYDSVVVLDKTVSVRTLSNPKRFMKYIEDNLVGLTIPVTDASGNIEVIEFAGANETTSKNNKRHPVLGELAYANGDTRKQVIVNAKEVIEESLYDPQYSNTNNEHGWLDKNGWESRKTYVLAQDGMIYEAYLKIAKAQDGRNILYAVNLDVKKGIAVDKGATSKRAAVLAAMPSGDKVAQEDPNVKRQFSLSTDSSGREVSVELQDRLQFSQVRDESGRLKPMFHGTPNGDYADFKAGTYFTENKEYADRYQNTGASSISSGKTASAPKTFEVYLDIRKPFDLSDPEAKRIYIEDYIKGGNAIGINPYLPDAEYDKIDTIDWTEGEDLRDFLVENGYDYDGLVLDEGADGGYGEDVKYRGKSYVIFSPDQAVKIDAPEVRFSLSEAVEETKDLMAIHNLRSSELPQALALGGMPMPSIAILKAQQSHESYGDVSLIFHKDTIDPEKNKYNKVYGGDAWTPTYPSMEYKVNKKAQEAIESKIDSLVPYEVQRGLGYLSLDYDNMSNDINRHNGNLSRVYENNYAMKYAFLVDNGFSEQLPMTEKNLDGSGRFNNDLVIEVAEKYGADEIKRLAHGSASLTDAVIADLRDMANENVKKKYSGDSKLLEALRKRALYTESNFGFSQANSIIYAAQNYLQSGIEQTVDYAQARDTIESSVNADEYKAWLDNLLSGIVEKEGIRNNADYYTPSGNRRSWEALHWENTLENVLKVMRAQNQTGAGFFGSTSIYGVANKNYGSIDEIKADSDRLQTIPEEEYDAMKSALTNRLADIADAIKNPNERNVYIARDQAVESIVDAVRTSKNKASILRNMQKWNKRVTPEIVDDIVSLVNDIANMPTGYFEAKPQRAVGFDEVAVFVIPRNADPKLKQELLNNGYSIAEYDPDVEGDRNKVVNQFEQYKFSLSNPGETPKTYGNFGTYGSDIALEEDLPIRQDVAAPVAETPVAETPAMEDDIPIAETVEETAETEQNVPIAEDVPSFAPIKNIQTTKGKLKVKLQNRQTELDNIEKARAEASKAYDEKIAKANATLDSKKNKDTKVANNLKKRIERLQRLKADIDAGYEKRINDIKKSIDKTSVELEKDHTEKDRYAKAVARIDAMLKHDKTELEREYNQRKEDLANRTSDKESYIVNTARELYNELRGLKKGVRASEKLGSLLDAGFDWGNLRSALSNVMYTPGETVNINSREESAVRQLINDSYEQDVYGIDDLDVELAEEIQKLEVEAEEKRTKARTATQRSLKHEEYTKLFEMLSGDTSTWKDKKLGISYQTNTLRRNLRDVVRDANGKRDIPRADAIYEELQGNYNRHEAGVNREENAYKKPFADMKITDAEDAYIQMLGEFRHNPATTLTEDVVKDFYNKHKKHINEDKVDKIIADARRDYDALFERLNERLREQGMKEIPYRQGYFPHFTNPKQNWLAKLFNWKVQDDSIPTDIAGLTEDFQPNRTWQSFNKQRKSDVTDYSFKKGYDSFVHGALDWIYHIEDIQKNRAFENYLRYIHSDQGVKDKISAILANEEYDADEAQAQIDLIYNEAANPLNNFVTNLRTRTNTLAGKKSSQDRGMEAATNRKVYSVMTNLSNRVNANMVAGSFSSALTNFIPITQSWAEVSPISSLRAMGDTIKSAIRDDGTIEKSAFLTNRLRKADNLYKTGWDKISEKATLLMEGIDSFTSQTVWRSKYLENISKGMSENEAIRNADQFAENVIAGRSRGNMPTIFDSKNPITKVFTAFQLEVANQYGYLFKDAPQDIDKKSKLIKGYASVFFGAYAYNALYSSLVGRDVALDPISIIEDLLKDLGVGDEDEEEPEEILTNLTDNILAEIPFVGGLMGGGRIPISSALPYDGNIKDIINGFAEGDKAELTSEWLKPVYYLATPLGGGQIKKTVEGLKMFDDDLPISGSYTKSGALRFPVEDTFGNRLKAGLFGQWSSKNAQDYIENGRTPLEEKQIEEFIDLDIPISEYWEYREGLSNHDKLSEKADYIDSLDLPISKKNILINNIADRKESINMKDYGDYGSFEEFDFAEKNPEKYKFLQDRNISWSKYVWNKEEYNYAYNNTEMYDFLQENGVSYKQYKSFDEDTKDAFSWAKENPEKYTMSKAISNDFLTYYGYKKDLGELNAKDANGNTVSGLKKQRVFDYIENLDLDYGEKIILYRSMYDSKSDKAMYNADILEYLNGRNDLSYAEKKTILEELDFKVSADGTVTW